MGRWPIEMRSLKPRSIVSRARAASERSRSPIYPSGSGDPMSMPDSLQLLDASDLSARRISSGAAAAPRRQDELASYGMPTRAGGPNMGPDDGVKASLRQP